MQIVKFFSLATLIFLSPISLSFCFSATPPSVEDEICITEEVLPKLPEKPQKQSPVLIPALKGIIVVDSSDSLLPDENYDSIRGVELIGHDFPGKTQVLKKNLNTFIGHEVSEGTLQDIKRTISNYYRQSGRPLVVVQVPEQNISKGVLVLSVLESRVGKVRVEGNKWSSDNRLLEYFRLRPDQVINEGHLRNDVHFVNRNPFRRIDIIYAPGEEPGTTDVILQAQENRSFRVYTGIDNTGVDPIGRGRYYAGFNWGNAFGLDHIMAYQYTRSLNINIFYAHTAEYIMPLPWKHVLDIYGGYSHVRPKHTSSIQKNTGWSLQGSLRYTVPLRVYQRYQHEITSGLDFKRTNNTFEFTEDFPTFGNNVNLAQFTIGYTGSYSRSSFQIDFDGSLFGSPGQWLSDQSNSDYSSLRIGAKNQWVYFRGSMAYLQRLPKAFSLSLICRGQVSSQTLLPSEQFGLGGYDTVRGYEERELNKDNALLLSLEGRSPTISLLQHGKDILQFLLFIDYGWGDNLTTIPGEENSQYILGAGPGLRYTVPPYINFRLDWGIKLHKQADYGGGNTMVHFGLTAAF